MNNLIIFLKFIFRLFFKKKRFNQKHFPLGYLDKKLKFKNNKYFFITNPYFITPKIYPFLNNFFTNDILRNMITMETIKSETDSKSKSFVSDVDFILTLSAKEENTKIEIEQQNKKVNKSISKNKNIYLHLKKNNNYKVSANKNIFFSNLQPTNLVDSDGIKLNLFIFIDGLSSILFNENNKDKLKNTKSFFSEGLHFKKHYCNQEWSLPSGANIFSGTHFQKHGVFHNENYSIINEELKLLPEFFDEKKYMTFMINGSHRLIPSYGYSKGFKRSLYKQSMSSNEVIDHFLEFEKVFSDTNKFVWLTFFDLHDAHNKSSISSNHYISNVEEEKLKFNQAFNNKYIDNYYNALQHLDNKLSFIYNHISNKYKNDEILISLITDHGQDFFDNQKKILKDSRIIIPWLLKGRDVKKGEVNEITENIDILPTILKLNNSNFDNQNIDGELPNYFGGKRKEFSLTQSIYPNSTYKSRVSFDDIYFDFESDEKINHLGKLKNTKLKFYESSKNPNDSRFEKAKKIIENKIKKLK